MEDFFYLFFMRFDKFVWAVRLTKTRSEASDFISRGKVRLNQIEVKPSKDPKIGDIIYVHKNAAVFSYKIVCLLEKRIGSKLVQLYIEEITPIEELDKYRTYNEAQKVYRDMGSGKPSKKDRRTLDDFLDF